ncbi:MAG: CerR family C-terminal domain-containing protein [Burkholderiales bacterium]|nr:CerR family C-terminal domain-containing protein [Burkholderiales bacterium]MDE2397178.1 CerR family C-terminal domain-containing protein [Burkholderiales bacterium]MDE2452528.1 CerR family C-terminal domain-containing protein [Burkholderiales bacterium]
MKTPPSEQVPAARAEAAQPRTRLLNAALHLFAGQGFAKTSVRQIALEAQTNVAAVSYYFGDKAGLYRAVFCDEPVTGREARPCCDGPLTLETLFDRFLEPLRSGDQLREWVKLHRREMLEPTGLWQEKLEQEIQPMHARLVALLCSRLGLEQADDDVHRLAISIAGLAIHLFIACDVIDALAPQLGRTNDSIDRWRERLLGYADAMVEAERQRRLATPPKRSPSTRKRP